MGAFSLPELTSSLESGISLDPEQIAFAVDALSAESTDSEEKKAFLVAMHTKGESVEEVTGFAAGFRELALKPSSELLALSADALDFVGTGGDHSNAFNISTGVCMILASGGVPVLKHGGRGATTPSGTADMQDALGFKSVLSEQGMLGLFKARNFAFFFAPAFHPAFKHIVPVRKALAQEGKRTIFNVLGPLINPSQPGYQVLGVYDKKWVQPLAETLTKLGRKRGVVIHSQTASGQAVDKAITAGTTYYAGVGELAGERGEWTASDFGLESSDFSELQSETAEKNAERLVRIYAGEEAGGLLDTLCLNSGIGLWAAGKVESVAEGISMAQAWVKSGQTAQWLAETQAFFKTCS